MDYNNYIDKEANKNNMKQLLQENFNHWLEELATYPQPEGNNHKEPDLYSFYEELCVLRSEFRKNARRSHETFLRFGNSLAQFEDLTKDILCKLSESRNKREELNILEKKKVYLPLVEIFERLRRVEKRLDSPPRARFFLKQKDWHNAWESLREGLNILSLHFEEILKKQGISKIITIGKLFDPSQMKAIEIDHTDEKEPNTVIEEFSSGYLYSGHILKLAEVKIVKKKGI